MTSQAETSQAVAYQIIYEVNLSVDSELQQAYSEWLQQHIRQMLALPGFIDARCYRVIDPLPAGKVCWTVQYVLTNQASLDQYLKEHAARMREDGVNHFGNRFSATRRIYQPV